GQDVANANGGWSVRADLLADGTYIITAEATDRAGNTTASATILPASHPLVIDTVAPKVVGMSFDRRRGQVEVLFLDNQSGLNPATLSAAGNYTVVLNRRRSRKAVSSPLQVHTALSSSSSGPATVVLTIDGFSRLRRGSATLTIRS